MDQSLRVVQTDSPSARLLVGSRAVEFVVLVAALCHTASRFGTARRTGGGRDKVVQGGAAVYSACSRQAGGGAGLPRPPTLGSPA
jgi:hypothetical protein